MLYNELVLAIASFAARFANERQGLPSNIALQLKNSRTACDKPGVRKNMHLPKSILPYQRIQRHQSIHPNAGVMSDNKLLANL